MIETERLLLRQWRDDDYPVFAQLNADPVVMRYFPAIRPQAESDAEANRIKDIIVAQGWGLWAAELKSTGTFIGLIGLHHQPIESGIPQAPLIEVGWRLHRQYWGQGYATEGAKHAIQFAFDTLKVPVVYAFTALSNIPSQRVMIKAGMTNTGKDFNHPKLPTGHVLERHCMYCINRR